MSLCQRLQRLWWICCRCISLCLFGTHLWTCIYLVLVWTCWCHLLFYCVRACTESALSSLDDCCTSVTWDRCQWVGTSHLTDSHRIQSCWNRGVCSMSPAALDFLHPSEKSLDGVESSLLLFSCQKIICCPSVYTWCSLIPSLEQLLCCLTPWIQGLARTDFHSTSLMLWI